LDEEIAGGRSGGWKEEKAINTGFPFKKFFLSN